ncbi:MOSC domain-containing protein [Plantactinospora sp. KBS50]|nr:MOSC N-terminal beta barrel domain-containing protein [Plantactinospora sp. KBS50]ASW53866.1 MOSC domain-containing protein [Plantactinospora sp. KBS50]
MDAVLEAIHTYPVKGCHRLDHDIAPVQPWGLAGDRRWMAVDADGVGTTQRTLPELVSLHAEPQPGGLLLRAPGRPVLVLREPVGAAPVPVRVFPTRRPVPAHPAGPAADLWLSEALGRGVRLVWLGRPGRHLAPTDRPVDPGDRVSFADEYPLLLANRASLAALNEWLRADGSAEGPLPMTRFRPNLVISGADPFAEEDWVGRRIRIGAVVFLAAGDCSRCVVTTVDQETGVRGREPLRTLARHHRRGQRLPFGVHLIPEPTIGDAGGSGEVGAGEAGAGEAGAGGEVIGGEVIGSVAVGDRVRPLPAEVDRPIGSGVHGLGVD